MCKNRWNKVTLVTLVLPFCHKFREIQHVLQKFYNKMILRNPELNWIFPDPPMISFRWASNFQEKVVQTNHSGHKTYQPILPLGRKSYIADLINHTKTVTNIISKRTCYIEGSNTNTIGAIYSVLSTTHKNLCVGRIRQSINERFNGHRSDAVHYTDRSNLTQQDNENDCDIRHDLEISVLEHNF